MRRHAAISCGTVVIAAASVGVAVLSPLAALLLYLPVFAAFVVARILESGSRPARTDE